MIKIGSSKKMQWIVGSAAAFVFALIVASTIYAIHFASVALPKTSVVGVPVSGQTQDQIVAGVKKRVTDLRTPIEIDEEVALATLDDFGVKVDARAMAKQALKPNMSIVSRFTEVFRPNDVPVIYKLDSKKLKEFAESLAVDVKADAQNGDVLLDQENQVYVVADAKAGRGLDVSDLKGIAKRAASTLKPHMEKLETVEIDPTVSTEDAEEVAEKANALLDLEIVLKGNVSVNPASFEEKVSWIVIPKSDEGLKEPSIDNEKVADWVRRVAESTNEVPVKGVYNVNAKGEVLSIASQGQKGYTVNNSQEIADQLVAALSEVKSYTGQFVYDETEPEYEKRLIAEGSENLAYQAAPGEKWIDVNLSNYTVAAYEGATLVKGPTSVVLGRPGAETPAGNFKIYTKFQQQTMRGQYPDGTKYVTPNVPWIMYFHGGYALHGAYWRSSFGYAGPTGSNGCVNLPVDVANWYYNWSSVGTVVVSHR